MTQAQIELFGRARFIERLRACLTVGYPAPAPAPRYRAAIGVGANSEVQLGPNFKVANATTAMEIARGAKVRAEEGVTFENNDVAIDNSGDFYGPGIEID